jgi:hypothetical protein
MFRQEISNAARPDTPGWHESSWELSQGLEVSSIDGELPEEFAARMQASAHAPTPSTNSCLASVSLSPSRQATTS